MDLREIPSAVGGDRAARRGIILAKSIPAGTLGIRTGETIGEARRKCPDLALVPPDYCLYQKASAAFVRLLGEFTPAVEPYSVDECYLDMTGTEALWGGWRAAAEAIRRRVREELGFTVNIGVSENKLLAKMASDLEKPDRIHTLFPEEISEKMWPLPVGSLFFVGQATKEKLLRLGIRTVGELAAMDRRLLALHLKRPGERLWDFANGLDESPVEKEPPFPKSCGNSVTLAFDAEDLETARLALLSLCETVGSRLRGQSLSVKTVTVGIRRFDFSSSSCQETLPSPVCHTDRLWEAACRLLERLWDGTPLRHIGVWGGGIQRSGEWDQEEWNGMAGPFWGIGQRERMARLDRMADQIRRRYGADSLMRAAFLNSPVEHMAGGPPL